MPRRKVAASPCEDSTRALVIDPAEAELLARLLAAPGAKRSPEELATNLLARFGGLWGVQHTPPEELAEVPGMSPALIQRVLAAGGMCEVRLPTAPGTLLASSASVFEYLKPRLAGLQHEVFVVLALDVANRLKREFTVGQGTLTACPAHPREVFRPLIREAAAAAILAHNHPSGEPEPSADDLTLTRRLVRAGELLGIRVLDHVVVARRGYVSLAERGVIS